MCSCNTLHLAALLGGPQGQPGGLSGLPHGHAPLQDVGQIRRQRRRLPQAPGYAVPCPTTTPTITSPIQFTNFIHMFNPAIHPGF